MEKPKILFFPHHNGLLPVHCSSSSQVKTSRRASLGPEVRRLKQQVSVCTPNPGNLVHSEAPSDIICCSEIASSKCNLINLCKSIGTVRAAEVISSEYDAVVISLANDIRSGWGSESHSLFASLIRDLEIPVHIFGLGLQDAGEIHIDERLDNFLRAASERAATFGVRGERTKEFLDFAGYSNSIVLGCPSMYRSPRGVLECADKYDLQAASLLSGGYFHSPRRHRALELVAQCIPATKKAYIFQNDLFSFIREGSDAYSIPIYNQWTGSLDPNVIHLCYKDLHRSKSCFSEFRFFTNLTAWCQYASGFDLYIGDRLHSAIAAMTAGTPAVLLYNDHRVLEIAELYSIPCISLNQLDGRRSEDIVEMLSKLLEPSNLSKFQADYKRRFSIFNGHLHRVGLQLNSSVLEEFSRCAGKEN